MFHLGKRSKERLEGLHPDLVAVVEKAIIMTRVDFTVLEGVRSNERQRELFEAGASETMNSRHKVKSKLDGGTGYAYAVDLGAYVAGEVRWDWPLYDKIYDAMHAAAEELDIDMVWGGDWDDDGETEDETGLRDGPHFQLAWRSYPA